MPKPTKALPAPAVLDLDKLDAAQIGHNVRFDAEACGVRALAMLQHVEGLRKERSIKAILAGLYLHQVKATLGHGSFGDWLSQHLGKADRTARRYMSLASIFARKSALLLPEMLGANQLTLDLQAQDSEGRAILGKLDAFVGTEGLTALMQKHGVVPKPDKNTLAGTLAAEREEAFAKKSPEEQHAEAIAILRRQAIETLTHFNEIGDKWQLLTDDQLRVTLADCKALSKVIQGWLDTPKPRRLAFDPTPFLDGSAEKALLNGRHEGTAFAVAASSADA